MTTVSDYGSSTTPEMKTMVMIITLFNECLSAILGTFKLLMHQHQRTEFWGMLLTIYTCSPCTKASFT